MTPSKQGQICKLNELGVDENPQATYLIVEDISRYSPDQITYVVSLTELQRNVQNPLQAPRKAVTLDEMTVVAEDLTTYVESWNRLFDQT